MLATYTAETKLRHENKTKRQANALDGRQKPSSANNEKGSCDKNLGAEKEMRIYNKTTGRFYLGYSSSASRPCWGPPFNKTLALRMTQADADVAVKQMTALEPSLDLLVVSDSDSI